jgi:uncharacterized protein YdeI (YjbR/CyaY-like superfamily)
MSPKNPIIDVLLSKTKKWQKEFAKLRTIVLGCGLTEELKWGQACYTLKGKNVLLIHGFKEYCALLFIKGALLKDPKDILIQQTKNVQAGRQIRFSNLQEIVKQESVLKAYIREAIKVEKSGLKVHLKKHSEYIIPEEFKYKLNRDPALRNAFETLTPGRQRGYILYFSGPKQSKTREARIEKCVEQIMDGLGLHDQYT